MGTYSFITGPAGTGKTEYVYETLTKRALLEPNRRFYLFVPEQNTLKAQQEIIRHSPVNGMLNLDVLSFSLLSYRVLEELDLETPELLDEVAKTMLLRRVLSKVKNDLKVYGRKTQSPGFMAQLKRLITEFGQYRVSPQTLRMAEKDHEEELLGGKLHDTALILEKFYEDLHAENGRAIPEELPEILLRHIEESHLLDDACILFDSFTGFTPVQLELLSEIVKKAAHTEIAVTIPRGEKTKANGSLSDLFWFPRRGISQVIDQMSKNGLTHTKDMETDGAPVRAGGGDGFIRKVFHADDPVEEVSFLAEDIQRKAMPAEKGAACTRYRRMALCVSDLNIYRELIRREFTDRKIPFFMDDPATGDTSPVTGLLRSCLDVIVNGCEFEDVITYLRNLYVTGSAERELLDRFENYLRETGRSGWKKYEENWAEAAYIPEGYDILAIERFKAEKFAPVYRLHDALKAGKTAGEKAEATEAYLSEIFPEEPSGEDEDTLRDARFLKMLYAMTDRIQNLLGKEEMSMQAFAEMVRAGLSEMKAGQIPATMDCVTVGDLKRSRLDGIDYLYIVGANEGLIPSAVTGTGIFTDAERQQLMNLEIELAPDDRRDASVQEYYLYLTEHKPAKGLFITYPFSDRDGRGLRRSAHVKETGERIPYGEKKCIEKSIEYSNATEKISKKTANSVYGETIHGSVTSAETYRRCPFSYYAAYGLKLTERKNRDIEAVDLGRVYHAALDDAVRKLSEEKKQIAKVSDTELDLLADTVVAKAVDNYSGSLFFSDARSRFLSKEITKTVKRTLRNIAAQQRAGCFHILATEKKFRVQEPGLELTGIIDRIDMAEGSESGRTFVNVVDYKSGTKQIDLSRMLDGIDMQLPTYLGEAVKQAEIIGRPKGTVFPAGMYYYHVANPIVSENEDPLLKMILKGITAEDDEAIRALDASIEAGGEKSPVNGLKYDRKKNRYSGGVVVSAAVMEGLLRNTREILRQDAGRIKDGDIRVYPFADGNETACDYCRYRAVCGLDRRMPGTKVRRIHSVKQEEIEDKFG